MEFIDEQNDIFHLTNLVHHRLDTFLELAAVFRPSDHQGEVEGDHLLVAKDFRHVPRGDFLGETFDDGGLADASLTNEDRVIFRAAAENLDDSLDFALATDDRIESTVAGHFRQIATKGLEGRSLGFRLTLGTGCLGLAFVGERSIAILGLVVVIIIVLIIWRKIGIDFGENFVPRPLDVHVQSLEDTSCDAFALAQQTEE